MTLTDCMAHPKVMYILCSSLHDRSHCPLEVVQGQKSLGIDLSGCLSGLGGHSADLALVTTYALGFLLVPILQLLGKASFPPPTCPSCLSMPGQWGRGPAPRSPVLTPSRILGLMSCKMRRLQLTRTDGARTRLLAQHAPSSTRRILLQTFSLSSSGMSLHGVHSL